MYIYVFAIIIIVIILRPDKGYLKYVFQMSRGCPAFADNALISSPKWIVVVENDLHIENLG